MLENLTVITGEGDWKPIRCFQQSDHDLLTNARAHDKIARQLAASPHRFDISVFMGDPSNRVHLPLIRDADQLAEHTGRRVDPTGCIVLYYGNNVTGLDNHHPMTAWIMIHRIHHAMLVREKDFHDSMMFDQSTWEALVRIAWHVGDDNMRAGVSGYEWQDLWSTDMRWYGRNTSQDLLQLANTLFTMRSARNRRINNPFDVSAECLAQHVISGRVRFNRVEDWNMRHLPWARIRDRDHLNELIQRSEQEVDAACARTMDSLVGKITGW
jgi:hypothetical protein